MNKNKILKESTVFAFIKENAPCSVKKVIRELGPSQKIINSLHKQGKITMSQAKTMIRRDPNWETSKPYTKPAEAKQSEKSAKWVAFRVFCLLISLACAVVSVQYSFIWLQQLMAAWLALLLTIALVGSGIVFFEGIILLWPHNRFASIVFAILWVITTTFSIGSSVAGQFDKFESSRIARSDPRREQLKSLDMSIIETEQNYNALQGERNTIADSLQEDPTNANIIIRLQSKRREITKAQADLKTLRDQKQSIIDALGGSDVKKDFFQIIAEVFKIDAQTIYFIMAFWPAIFIDLVAPLGVALFLFVKDQ